MNLCALIRWALMAVALALIFTPGNSANAALSFTVSNDPWPAGWRDAAINSMQAIVDLHNAYGDFGNYDVYVYYNAGIRTAQANYLGSIGVGGTFPGQRVLLHEANHYLGSGTTSNWTNRFTNNIWTGQKASALFAQFDGDNTVMRQSGVHFYGYGLNYDSEVVNNSILSRNVAIMYAMRQDMGLGNAADPWTATNVTMTQSDALGTSSFNWQGNWSDGYFAHPNASYSTGNFLLRTPLDTYDPGGATPSFTFVGNSLTINNTNGINGGLLFKGVGSTGNLNFKNLILDGGYVRHASNSGDIFRLAGKVTLTNSPTIDAAQGPIHVTANMSGAGSLTKTGSFALTLAGANSYAGNTNINAGVLRIAPLEPVANYTFDNVNGSTVVNGGTGGANMNGTLANGATVVGGGRFGNAVSLAGGASVNINSPIIDLNNTGNWTVSAWVKTSTPGGSILTKGEGNSWFNGNTIFYLGDGTSGGSGGIPSGVRWAGGFYQGATNATSVTNNAWRMVTYVNNGGTYSLYVDGVAQPLSVGNNSFGNGDIGTMVRLGVSTNSVAGDGTLNFNGLMDSVQFYNQALSAAQVGSLFNGNNSLGSLPATTNVSIANGATLDVNGATQQIGSLTGVAGSAVTLGSGQLIVNSSASTQFAGTISGAGGSLVKQGAGTLTVTGTNTYTGGTQINAGILRASGSTAGPVSVNSGGALQGVGILSGLVTVAGGGILSPGTDTSTGVLNIGSLNLSSGSKVQINVSGITAGSQYDIVHVNGAATLGGTLELLPTNGFGPLLGNSFDILNWSSRSGTFANIVLPPLETGLAWNKTKLYSEGVLSIIDGNYLPGDLDRNGSVTDADLSAMLKALVDLESYRTTHGPGGGALSLGQLVQIGDLNGDNKVTNGDIQSLINYLIDFSGSGSVAAVPEPAGILLAAAAGLSVLIVRRGRIPGHWPGR